MTTINSISLARGLAPIVEAFTLTGAANYDLPSTGVKAGQMLTVYNDTANDSILTIRSSDTSSVETIRLGYCQLVAKQDTPTASTHWRVLNVYEEGLWTPVLIFGGGNGNASIVSTGGGRDTIFRRVNKAVTLLGYSTITKGTATGSLTIGGLPYTSTSSWQANHSWFEDRLTPPAGYGNMNVEIAPGSTILTLTWAANTNVAGIGLTATDISVSASDIIYGGTYYKA